MPKKEELSPSKAEGAIACALLVQGNVQLKFFSLTWIQGPQLHFCVCHHSTVCLSVGCRTGKATKTSTCCVFSRDAKADHVGVELESAWVLSRRRLLSVTLNYGHDEHTWISKSSSVRLHIKTCLLLRYILTAQIIASVKVFYLHVKSKDHCEEVGTQCG